MKLLILLLVLTISISALNLASHNEWDEPRGRCKAVLNSQVDNEDGKMVVKPYGQKYEETCFDILLDDSKVCTLYATCRDRDQAFKFAKLRLPADLARFCCQN